CARRHETYDFW
nr:immunoglobulin heavy chain junction region [Macaca mulatta]